MKAMKKTSNQEKPFVQLKEATVADIPILLGLEKAVSGTNIYSPMLDEGEWQEELGKSHVFLVENESGIIGNVSYEQKENDHAYISGLVIDPHFQGRGIGRQVLTQLLERLKDAKRIDLVTHPDNHAALHLYQSLGFAVESRKENYYGDGEPRLVLALKRE